MRRPPCQRKMTNYPETHSGRPTMRTELTATLDILGFKHIVQTRTPRDVYGIVDKVVGEFKKRGDNIEVFRTLYFSDTIIFYQEPVGWGSWAFAEIGRA